MIGPNLAWFCKREDISQMYIIMIDLQKAYDAINLGFLLDMLKGLGLQTLH